MYAAHYRAFSAARAQQHTHKQPQQNQYAGDLMSRLEKMSERDTLVMTFARIYGHGEQRADTK